MIAVWALPFDTSGRELSDVVSQVKNTRPQALNKDEQEGISLQLIDQEGLLKSSDCENQDLSQCIDSQNETADQNKDSSRSRDHANIYSDVNIHHAQDDIELR